MIQYPHTLYLITPKEAIKGSTGDWEDQTGAAIVTDDLGACREEPNGSGATITLEDGTVHKFSSMIYLPKQDLTLVAGQSVQVNDEAGNVMFTGTIARFDKGRLNCRIWA